ncbi:protein shisa-5-like isoform X2 [Centroberyx gerrardi]
MECCWATCCLGGTGRLKQSCNTVSFITLLQGIIAAMVSGVLSSLACALFVTLLPAVSADDCPSYWDTSSDFHDVQQCGSSYCCGTCNKKYCCTDARFRLSQDKQERCTESSGITKGKRIALLVGSILGTLFPIIICVCLIICCVSPCCFLYKKCQRRRSRRPQTVINTAVVNAPLQPSAPSGHQHPYQGGQYPGGQYPGYQPVPLQFGYGAQPMPTAPPPSYMEASYAPVSMPYSPAPGQPVYPFQHPSQPHALPPHLDDLAHPPYNPSYCDGPSPKIG